MKFETKIAVVLRDGLAPWQELNVTAFLASGVAASNRELIGEAYRDGSGNEYYPMFRQPVMVFRADEEQMWAAFLRSRESGARVAIYTRELFATGNDEDNRAAVAAVADGRLDLVGFAVHEKKKVVDTVVKGLPLHP
ncbi:MAG: DUF2000 family protein [Rectinemataceae bacterium]